MARKSGSGTVRIEVSPRGYFRGGRWYREGEILEVPEAAVPGITGASPPFGTVLESESERATEPEEEPEPEEG